VPLKGKNGTTGHLCRVISPITLIALLFTIVVMFFSRASKIVKLPLDVLGLPAPGRLLRHHVPGQLFHGEAGGSGLTRSATLAFTASGNNFELAIAVAIAVFGIASPVSPLPRSSARSSRCPSSSAWCMSPSGCGANIFHARSLRKPNPRVSIPSVKKTAPFSTARPAGH
jgi:hypothetical protein